MPRFDSDLDYYGWLACDDLKGPPPETDRDPGDEDPEPAPEPEPAERSDLRDYRQSLIDQQWRGR